MTSLPHYDWRFVPGSSRDGAVKPEWLLTNGLGGYASSTAAMCNTRKYHGLLIPSLPQYGRTVMLSRLDDELITEEGVVRLSGVERPGSGLELDCLQSMTNFRLQGLIPQWEFKVGGVSLSRTVVMVHGENTVYVVYRHREGPPAKLRLRPFASFRPHDAAPSNTIVPTRVDVAERGATLQVGDGPAMKITAGNCRFVTNASEPEQTLYRIEVARGYPSTETMASPGWFECELLPGSELAFCATLEGWECTERTGAEALELEQLRQSRLVERSPAAHEDQLCARLTLAADQFIITPNHRPADIARARALGQEAHSIIAGYPWFTDWGRDTMISLEGLTLCTGRFREAAAILRTFQHYVRDGLVPNYFPEGNNHGVYHTADATLWFFHALSRYLEVTRDEGMLKDMWPTLTEIVSKHLEGTRFNIHVDTKDGLLDQGEEGYQLTWMDAKVGDWVVTPRRGKAVELNALWFNALSLMRGWAPSMGADESTFAMAAERCAQSFNARFWNDSTQCLFDIVDGERGDDPSIRPNQVFSISLTHPILERTRWAQVLATVREHLLTPYGLRTLSPTHPDFRPTYDGDLRARDAAYHQGTVWPWLIGHYIDAVLKTDGSSRGDITGFAEHLTRSGLGSISEIFDATPPYQPRGCFAQAWSVAEVLRARLMTEKDG